jgi:hypothetical protein
MTLESAFGTDVTAGEQVQKNGLVKNCTYHLFALSNTDGSSSDYGFDTDVDAINLLADTAVVAEGLTKKKLIGSIITDASSNIVEFTARCYNDILDITYSERFTDYSSSTSLTTGALTLTVPTGLVVKAKLSVEFIDSSTCVYKLREENQTSGYMFASGTGSATRGASSYDLHTNTSGQVFHDDSNSDGTKNVYTYGYIQYL